MTFEGSCSSSYLPALVALVSCAVGYLIGRYSRGEFAMTSFECLVFFVLAGCAFLLTPLATAIVAAGVILLIFWTMGDVS